MGSKVNDANSSTVVDKAFMILEFIASQKGGVSLATLVKELDIPKTTIHRLLETMKERGYIEAIPDTEKVRLGLKAIDIGMSALSNQEIVDVSIPYLRELAEITGETAFLGVYVEGEIVYLYKAEGSKSMRISSQLGTRRPIHSTGLGKAIMAYSSLDEVDRVLKEKGMPEFTENTITEASRYHEELREVRINGFAKDAEEVEIGLGCFAAPVFNYTGSPAGAICISGPIQRIRENKPLLVEKLLEASDQISRRLGFVPSLRSVARM